MNFHAQYLISVVKLGPNHYPEPIPYTETMDDRLGDIKHIPGLPYSSTHLVCFTVGFERQYPKSGSK